MKSYYVYLCILWSWPIPIAKEYHANNVSMSGARSLWVHSQQLHLFCWIYMSWVMSTKSWIDPEIYCNIMKYWNRLIILWKNMARWQVTQLHKVVKGRGPVQQVVGTSTAMARLPIPFLGRRLKQIWGTNHKAHALPGFRIENCCSVFLHGAIYIHLPEMYNDVYCTYFGCGSQHQSPFEGKLIPRPKVRIDLQSGQLQNAHRLHVYEDGAKGKNGEDAS